MIIQHINNINHNLYTYKPQKNNKQTNQQKFEPKVTSIPLSSLQAYNISFGKFASVKEVPLINRNTGEKSTATIMREKDGSIIKYKLMKGRKELGYTTLQVIPNSSEDETHSTKKTLAVHFLRSLEGNSYKGIGSNLIMAAIDESKRQKCHGELILTSHKGYAKTLSDYRSDENPLPFYYRLGFKAINKEDNEKIQHLIDFRKYDELPEKAKLRLSPIDAFIAKEEYEAAMGIEE